MMGQSNPAKPTFLNRYRNAKGLIYMALPVLAYFILFCYLPMGGQVIAFKSYVISDGIFGSEWVGLENFERLFASQDFPKALLNTITLSLMRLTFGFVMPIVIALMLNEVRLEIFKRCSQTLLYLPHFFSWVILGGIFLMLFSGSGPLNQLVTLILDKPIPFLTDDIWFIIVLITTGVWQSMGWGSIIYLAALTAIPPTLYEAATIDGANRWKQTLHITIPSLIPTMITLFILSLGGILTAGFDQIYNLYNPMVYDVSDIIDTYVLRRMLDLDFSLATAAGMFKSVVGLIMVVSSNAIAKKLTRGEQGIY
jgi:putative aldouronate transport system permease protein